MALAFFKSKKRFVVLSSLIVGSFAISLFFQNCAAKSAGTNAITQGSTVDASNSTESVSKNMTNGASNTDLPVGRIGGAVSLDQLKGSSALLPGFTISKDEIKAIQLLNTDSINKYVVCKLFARPVVEVGEVASFMVVMYDQTGKENFDLYKDENEEAFKFPVGDLARMDFVGENKTAAGVSSVRQKLPLETHRLGHIVHYINDSSKIGLYSRNVEVFNKDGQLLCRTNTVSVAVVAATSSGGYIGSNKVKVSDKFGSKESNAQSFSRMFAAESCQTGRALVSKINDAGDGSYYVKNECLK